VFFLIAWESKIMFHGSFWDGKPKDFGAGGGGGGEIKKKKIKK